MSFFEELKRRNVFRVGVAYAIVAWLLVEVSSVLLPAFKVPEWVFCTSSKKSGPKTVSAKRQFLILS